MEHQKYRSFILDCKHIKMIQKRIKRIEVKEIYCPVCQKTEVVETLLPDEEVDIMKLRETRDFLVKKAKLKDPFIEEKLIAKSRQRRDRRQ